MTGETKLRKTKPKLPDSSKTGEKGVLDKGREDNDSSKNQNGENNNGSIIIISGR